MAPCDHQGAESSSILKKELKAVGGRGGHTLLLFVFGFTRYTIWCNSEQGTACGQQKYKKQYIESEAGQKDRKVIVTERKALGETDSIPGSCPSFSV